MDMAEYDEVGTIDGRDDCEDETVKRLPSKNLNKTMGYLIPKARLVFTRWRKAFIKALILQHFDPEYHIQIETNKSLQAMLLVEF